MDDNIKKFLKAMGMPEEIAALLGDADAVMVPQTVDPQTEAFRMMYPAFVTGDACDDPECGCDGSGMLTLTSAVN